VQIDSDYYIAVVDSLSDGGSEKLLKSSAERDSIRLVESKSSGGLGRQTAFLESKGEYVIDHIDLEDIYKPCFRDIIKYHHQNFEEKS